jgi:putative addiction module component (TIGR02574 family)
MELALNELTDQALSLSIEERAILAQRLWESIEGFIDTETEKAWLEESDRRWKDIKEGKVKCIPAEKAMKEARASLNRKQ